MVILLEQTQSTSYQCHNRLIRLLLVIGWKGFVR